MAKPTYIPPIGGLALSRYDFQNHFDGYTFRHTADQIDMNPPVIGTAATVQQSLANIEAFINTELLAGQGFIAIGDGYDTWHNANGTINFDPTIPPIDAILNPIFSSIINNIPLPAQYARIQRGGIVLIKAGTYIVKNSITVPPGIMLIGESYGTKIINATSLNTNIPFGVAPSPKASPTPAPVFIVSADFNRVIDDQLDSTSNYFIFQRRTVFSNMLISDNFVEPPVLGDTNYKLPQNKTGNNPLIYQNQGSNLILDNVMMAGRVNYSSGTIVSAATRFAVYLDQALAITTGTILQMNNCFVDGFSVPVYFQAIGGVNDYLEITNSKIKGYGYLDGTNTSELGNSIIVSNTNNITVNNNYLIANGVNTGSELAAVWLNNISNSPPANTNARSKIIVSGNRISIDRSFGAFSVDMLALAWNATNIPTATTYFSYQDIGNVINEDIGIKIASFDQSGLNAININNSISAIESTAQLLIASGGTISLVGTGTFLGKIQALNFNKIVTTTISYSINGAIPPVNADFVILCGVPSVSTTIAIGSNGASLPQGTINVLNTTGFATPGIASIVSSNGVQIVSYTGTSGGNQLTGCTGGSGTLTTGNTVTADINLTLPQISGNLGNNQIITIKDISGNLEQFPITLVRTASDTIDTFSGNKILYTNYGSWTLLGSPSNGWIFI